MTQAICFLRQSAKLPKMIILKSFTTALAFLVQSFFAKLLTDLKRVKSHPFLKITQKQLIPQKFSKRIVKSTSQRIATQFTIL